MILCQRLSINEIPTIDIYANPVNVLERFLSDETLQNLVVTADNPKEAGKKTAIGIIKRRNAKTLKESVSDYIEKPFKYISSKKEQNAKKALRDNSKNGITIMPALDDNQNLVCAYQRPIDDVMKISRDFYIKYSMIKQHGYSLADWFRVNKIKTVGMHGSNELQDILAYELYESGIDIIFSTGKYNKSFMGVKQVPLNQISDEILQKTDVVVNCSINLNSQIKSFEKVISLYDIVNEIYNYENRIGNTLQIANALADMGRKVYIFNLPGLKNQKNLSEREKNLLSSGCNFLFIKNAVKNKNSNEYQTAKNTVMGALNTARIRKGKDEVTWEDYCENFPNVSDTFLPASSKDDYTIIYDVQSKYVNIINGARYIPNIPEKPDYKIHFFGKSWVFGIHCADEFTIPGEFQNILNEEQKEIEVVSNTVPGTQEIFLANNMKNTHMTAPLEDIFVFVHNFQDYRDEQNLKVALKQDYIHSLSSERPHLYQDYGEIWVEAGHIGEGGSELIARQIYDKIFKENANPVPGNYINYYTPTAGRKLYYYSNETSILENSPELAKYIKLLEKEKVSADKQDSKIGAIVMNCNPFTLGHRYLIENSANKVEQLYIFVVEEDKSFFPFEERMELVKKGTADIPNVKVLPSGKFIISSLTFPGYFIKGENNEAVVDTSLDVTLFAKRIAPVLGINIRFCGEEPLDNITLQYNVSMREILPKYGIEFEIIKRKESGGHVISASRVRKLLERKNFDDIAKIVPTTTLNYLKEKFN